MQSKSMQGVPSLTQRAITIKHGSAPEIQAVNISVKKRRSDASKHSNEILYEMDGGVEEPFYRKRPLSKTMTTTKSTMTNEEDYQVEMTKSMDEGNTSETSSVHKNEIQHIETQQHKVLAWKMTPKVHFPVHQDSHLESPLPPESLTQYQGSLVPSMKIVGWNYLPEPVIEPPFEHRPDKSYLIHQNQPVPLSPLKVWPGYGGNLYFEPVHVESKPLNARDGSGQQIVYRSRSRATSRYTFGDTPDALSDSRYMSLPPSSPSRISRKNTPTMSQQLLQDLRAAQPNDLLFQRQMAHLDKDYVLNMKRNSKMHEDWSWIAGLESIGTLCIGDTGESMTKHPAKPYSRTLVAEKVPRNFVFHPGNNPKTVAAEQSSRPVPFVQVQIDTKKRNRYPMRNLSPWKQRKSSNTSTNNQAFMTTHRDGKRREPKRRIRLPSIPIRVKGHRVNETFCYNPWELLKIGSSKPIHSNASRAGSPSKIRSLARDVILQSRAQNHPSREEKENLSFTITRLLSPATRQKNAVKGEFATTPNTYPLEPIDQETDDEDKLNYETIKSAYFSTRGQRTTAGGRRVPNSTPC